MSASELQAAEALVRRRGRAQHHFAGAGAVRGQLGLARALECAAARVGLVPGIALMVHLDMFDAQIIAQNVINGADSLPPMALPFFLLAGESMNAGGLSRRIVSVALSAVGHVRGDPAVPAGAVPSLVTVPAKWFAGRGSPVHERQE